MHCSRSLITRGYSNWMVAIPLDNANCPRTVRVFVVNANTTLFDPLLWRTFIFPHEIIPQNSSTNLSHITLLLQYPQYHIQHITKNGLHNPLPYRHATWKSSSGKWSTCARSGFASSRLAPWKRISSWRCGISIMHVAVPWSLSGLRRQWKVRSRLA